MACTNDNCRYGTVFYFHYSVGGACSQYWVMLATLIGYLCHVYYLCQAWSSALVGRSEYVHYNF